MALIKWMQGIEYVSGLLAKRPKKGAIHSSHSQVLLATHRKAATQNPNCTRVYAVGEYNRTTQPSSAELDARERFAAVAAMVKVRAKDLTKIDDDQAAFLAQRDTAAGKKTMRAYLWLVCGAEYDQAHNG